MSGKSCAETIAMKSDLHVSENSHQCVLIAAVSDTIHTEWDPASVLTANQSLASKKGFWGLKCPHRSTQELMLL